MNKLVAELISMPKEKKAAAFDFLMGYLSKIKSDSEKCPVNEALESTLDDARLRSTTVTQRTNT